MSKVFHVQLYAFSAQVQVSTPDDGFFIDMTHDEFKNLGTQVREAMLNLDGRETVICAAFEIKKGDRLMGMVVKESQEHPSSMQIELENGTFLAAPKDSIFVIERVIS